MSSNNSYINQAFGTQISDYEVEQFLCRLCRGLIKDVHEHNCAHCIEKIVEALKVVEIVKSESNSSFKVSSGVTIK